MYLMNSQPDLYNSFANMHLGPPHNQMWPHNYNPYGMPNYPNTQPDSRESEMFNNKFYPPPNNKYGKNFE